MTMGGATTERERWIRRIELAGLLGLAAVHEVLRRSLAGDAIVSALFAPSGAHAAATLFLGLTFVGVRVALFVAVPGWIGARLCAALWQRYTSGRYGPS